MVVGFAHLTFEVCHTCLIDIDGNCPPIEIEVSEPVMNFYGTASTRQTIRFFGQDDTIELVAFANKIEGFGCHWHSELVREIRENPLIMPWPQWVTREEMSIVKARLGSSLKTMDGMTGRLKGLFGRPPLDIAVREPISDFQFGNRANSVGVYVSREADLTRLGKASTTLVGSQRFEVVFERLGGIGFEFIKKLD